MQGTKYKINLLKDRPVINLLGEICWGIQITSFEEKVGARKEVAEALLNRLINEEKNGNVDVFVTFSEMEIIRKSLEIVGKEIEEWEFQTRIGVTLEEVKNIPFFQIH